MAKRTQPTWLHEAQGEATRKQILGAAQVTFFELTYGAATIGGIVARAGVSRASFYRHFGGKLDVASALIDAVMPRFEMAWEGISSLEDHSVAAFARWLDELIAITQDETQIVRLIREIEATERTYSAVIFRTRARHTATIGALAGIILNPEASVFESDDAVRAYLLKLRTDDLVYGAACDLGRINLSVARNIVAEELSAFITQAGRSGARDKERKTAVKA